MYRTLAYIQQLKKKDKCVDSYLDRTVHGGLLVVNYW